MTDDRYRVIVPDADFYRQMVKCQATCPVNTDARGYIAAIAEGDYERAYRIARAPNPLAAVCGLVCNAPCEAACRRGDMDEPLTIRALKRFAVDQATAQGKDTLHEPGHEPPPRPERVAVAGSGPAGLGAAYHLARLGYPVTVFEALPVIGGMLRVGIPAYRLPRAVLDRLVEQLTEMGVEFKLNSPVTNIEALLARGYAAIFLAIGAHQPNELGIPGERETEGVYYGVAFLRAVALTEEGSPLLPDVERPSLAGRSVAVIGGGNTAIDVARTAVRLGTREVTLVYRRSRAEMTALPDEVKEAQAEGVETMFLASPVEILSDDEHRVRGLRCVRMALGEPDASGRRRPIPIEGSEFTMEVETVIAAVAQSPEISLLQQSGGLEFTARGTFVVDEGTLATTRPGIFAGGDAARGPGIVVEAVAQGQRAARSIDAYLRGRRETRTTWRFEIVRDHRMPAGYQRLPRRQVPTLPVERRVGDAVVELGFDEETAVEQATRCLKCHINTIFDASKCILCGGCVDVCPWNCLKIVRVDELSGDGVLSAVLEAHLGASIETWAAETRPTVAAMIKDDTTCTRCGLCATRCPTGAITMEAFQFESVI